MAMLPSSVFWDSASSSSVRGVEGVVGMVGRVGSAARILGGLTSSGETV